MCFNYNALQEHIEKIKESFDFVSIYSIGKSWCKRNIYSLSIGEGESCVLFLSDFSDTAGITSEILLTFFERLCIAYKNDLKISAVKIRSILRDQKIVIVPITNPDGLEIMQGIISMKDRWMSLKKRCFRQCIWLREKIWAS